LFGREKVMEINVLLIIVALIFVAGAIGGWRQGLIEGVIGLVSCLLGLLVLALLVAGVGDFMSKSYVRVAVAFVLLAVISAIYKVVKLVLDAFKLLRAIPIGKLADKLAGIVLGLAESLFIVWLVFFALDNVTIMNVNEWVMGQVAGNGMLTSLYNSNIIYSIISKITSEIHPIVEVLQDKAGKNL
jgi:uncharacterized membrane protein required for colicin V production